jgi:hypothetical protein
MAYGVCKLTGNSGQFVEAHLIPKALTKLRGGNHFISGGQGDLPKKSFNSWYDGELVVRKGEAILAEYDTWAIRELRRLELVWSGWDCKTLLPVPKRLVECADPGKLRLFFLSLLWRAAATTRPEFREVELNPAELELLRTMVRDRNPRPLDFYPISLLQIVSRGPDHNLGPIRKEFRSDDEELAFSSYRFYFDGLISLMYREQIDRTKFGTYFIGDASTLTVMTQTWEDSYQFANMLQHMRETTAQWPERIRKLTTKSHRREAR